MGAEKDAGTMVVGPWAEEKLECLRKYLNAYTTIMRKQTFKKYFYIDAFAGPGSLKIRQERQAPSAEQLLLNVADDAVKDAGQAKYIAGSPKVALEIEHPFTDYVFVELDPARIQELHDLKEVHGASARIHIREMDCNEYLQELVGRVDRKQWRGVVFLDPFGMQVPWQTIADIAAMKAIEVFINFPVGMAIQRLLKRSGQFTDMERSKIDDYFGTDEWYPLLYQEKPSLFRDDRSPAAMEKVPESDDALVKWYRQRLEEAFGYASNAREIQDTTGRPLYYLIFAGPNKTGAKIANHVLKQGARQIR